MISRTPRRLSTMSVVDASRTLGAADGELATRLEQHRAGADRLLLPDARLPVRGRGRRPGDVHPRVARLSTASRAERRCARGSTASRRTSASTCSTAASAARGRWTSGRRASPSLANLHTLPEATWIQPIPDGLVAARGRSGRGGRRARDDPAGVRRRAAAPAAPPACGADPVRGAALEGVGGRRAARARASRRSTARCSAPARRSRRRRRERDPTRRWTSRTVSCSPATSRRSSATTSTRSPR